MEKWFGKKKQLAAVRTVCSHINNMFQGVTKVRRVRGEVVRGVGWCGE